jgi:hypothetical protein
MLVLSKGQTAQFKFVFTDFDGTIYDPTSLATPVDITVYVVRGDNGAGPIIDGPYLYLNQDPEATGNRIEKISNGEYTFHYTIPQNLYEYNYTVLARTNSATRNINIGSVFQVKQSTNTLSPATITSPKSSVINYKPTYQQLSRNNTSTILLIGHADGVQLNYPVKINSIQQAVDLLQADLNSPLLRGVLDAYSCGARDIMICAAAPMIEYVSSYEGRFMSTTVFNRDQATPSSQTFYEKYYERLQQTYEDIIDLDFVDIVVPLETSIINTDSVDFVTQLANYCSNFHNSTGNVQIGVIGSKTNGIKAADIDILEQNPIFTNKFTVYNESTGQISSDKGRYIVPVYGEMVFQHPQIKLSYVSNAAAAVAGMISDSPVNKALIRSRIPGAMSLFGNDLTQAEYQRLEDIGVNTLYRGKKTRRAVPFEVYITNEYTMANQYSTFTKLAQMRLVSLVVSEIKGIALSHFDIMAFDQIVSETREFLQLLKRNSVINDFSFNVQISETQRGVFIFEVELLSSFGLKRIDFSLAAGPGA